MERHQELEKGIRPRLSAPYTAADGRRFGFTLGAALLVLAALASWRGHIVTRAVFGVFGIALAAAATLAPAMLESVERQWMRLSRAISRVTTPVFLAVVYFLVLTPMGVLRRLVGGNPLVHRGGPNAFWVDRSQSPRSSLYRQF